MVTEFEKDVIIMDAATASAITGNYPNRKYLEPLKISETVYSLPVSILADSDFDSVMSTLNSLEQKRLKITVETVSEYSGNTVVYSVNNI